MVLIDDICRTNKCNNVADNVVDVSMTQVFSFFGTEFVADPTIKTSILLCDDCYKRLVNPESMSAGYKMVSNLNDYVGM